MALAPAGRFGLGAVPAGWGFPAGFAASRFSGPAALREKYYPVSSGGYPGYVYSRIPDGADWIPGVNGIGGQSEIQGFVGPTDNRGNFATDGHGNILFWNASGQLVTQNDLPASSGAAVYATSLADAYNPSSAHFGLGIQFPNGGFQQFDPVQAVSVRGRMANLGEDQATAEARAAAASKILGVAVQPLPVKAPVPAPPPSYATPPGMKLPVNTVPPYQPTMPTPDLPVNTAPPYQPTMPTPDTPVTAPPVTAGFGGMAALVLGGGLLFALTRKGKR